MDFSAYHTRIGGKSSQSSDPIRNSFFRLHFWLPFYGISLLSPYFSLSCSLVNRAPATHTFDWWSIFQSFLPRRPIKTKPTHVYHGAAPYSFYSYITLYNKQTHIHVSSRMHECTSIFMSKGSFVFTMILSASLFFEGVSQSTPHSSSSFFSHMQTNWIDTHF